MAWSHGTTVQKGYGQAHRNQRAQWEPLVASGQVRCARCRRPILPGQDWHLDHAADRLTYLGPSHAGCNRKAGARNGARITNAIRRRAALRRLPQW